MKAIEWNENWFHWCDWLKWNENQSALSESNCNEMQIDRDESNGMKWNWFH